jgi:hypothetical protein
MRKYQCIGPLVDAGIKYDDALALRRIAMTLHRWHELECGDSNDYGSWCITRGRKNGKAFEHDDDGTPFMERHHYAHGRGSDSVSHDRLPDHERGARKRLAKILSYYPGWQAYVQTDPRGAALYLLRPGDLPAGAKLDECYSRGLAVYR